MNKIRHAVIGLGWFGEKHCEALAAIPNVEIAALCTRTEDRLKEVASTFGVQKTYTDYHQLLADPDIDSVSITTMWDQHAESGHGFGEVPDDVMELVKNGQEHIPILTDGNGSRSIATSCTSMM